MRRAFMADELTPSTQHVVMVESDIAAVMRDAGTRSVAVAVILATTPPASVAMAIEVTALALPAAAAPDVCVVPVSIVGAMSDAVAAGQDTATLAFVTTAVDDTASVPLAAAAPVVCAALVSIVGAMSVAVVAVPDMFPHVSVCMVGDTIPYTRPVVMVEFDIAAP